MPVRTTPKDIAAVALVMAILAIAFVVAGCTGPTPAPASEGNAENPTGVEREKGTMPLAAALVAVDDHIAIGAPIHRDGLTLYPIVDPNVAPRPEGDFLSLKDAIESDMLAVSEVSDGGSVPTLQVHNKGSKPVLLTVGDVVKGGKQDRVIVEDIVIAPSPEPIAVKVNCVEHGRWSRSAGGLAFGYGGKAESSLKRVLQLEKSQSATWDTVAELNSAKARHLEVASLQPALVSEEAEPVQIASSQSIDRGAQSALEPTTGTYMASLETPEVVEQTKARTDHFLAVLADVPNLIGLVVAVDGKIVTCEMFGHPALFERVRDETVQSFVLDAMSHGAKEGDVPPAGEAARFLRDALTSKATAETKSGDYLQFEAEGDESRCYQLRDKDGRVLHLNAYK